MTAQDHIPAAHGAGALKAVCLVTALFGLSLGTATMLIAPTPARPVAMLVSVTVVGIALALFVYAVRPGLFSDSDTFGDALRTRYRTPEPRAIAGTGSRAVLPVSEHIAGWQSVRRVPAGERVLTRSYARLVARQALAIVVVAVVFEAVAGGVSLALGLTDPAVFFVAAAVVLPVGFALSHRAGLVDATDYPSAPMAPMLTAPASAIAATPDASPAATSHGTVPELRAVPTADPVEGHAA